LGVEEVIEGHDAEEGGNRGARNGKVGGEYSALTAGFEYHGAKDYDAVRANNLV
jgi:hypothetical protein